MHPNKASKGHKLTAKIAQETKGEKDKLFDNDIQALLKKIVNDVKELANKHSKTEDKVKQLVMAHSNYKAKRESNMFNPLVHHIMAEVNKDCVPGHCKHLQEIQQMALKELPNLIEEEGEELLKELNKYHKHIGAKVHPVHLDHEFLLDWRSHINDTIFPIWVHSNNSAQFIVDEFKMSLEEFAQRLEKWAMSQDTRPKHTSKLITLQKECAVMIIKGLHEYQDNTCIVRSHLKFDTNIQLAHKVTVINDVCLSHDALKGGECGWVEMSTHEHNDLKQTLKGKASTEKGTKKRKRGGNDENIDPSGRPPTKKARKVKKGSKGKKSILTQLLPSVRSHSVVDSNDND
ncbi:hypothetical protein P691DRAFT_767628 [Macrolepiota fuliginosa MF-IS2]|uniref:Uncharacterized protein n=1 Tax=Macrolepiota fuliginosa MF-IS2 TaxID=1400762 RepID=A0A9P5WWV1_9AGAR|nr:hypothetical protein P691DRAFT_767628 [Macrolepiota fuliginosa MF-IS2]